MNAHQAVCHLCDFLKAITTERPVPARNVGWLRKLVRFVAFTLPFRWFRGLPTSPEVDAMRLGSKPDVFSSDHEALKTLLKQVSEIKTDVVLHYAWGDLSKDELGRYCYRHCDHHLQQFGC
jgi:hypothetical protein